MTDKIEEAIEEREWESLSDDELIEAEEILRERKNQENKERSFDYVLTADKWIGVNKALISRGMEARHI